MSQALYVHLASLMYTHVYKTCTRAKRSDRQLHTIQREWQCDLSTCRTERENIPVASLKWDSAPSGRCGPISVGKRRSNSCSSDIQMCVCVCMYMHIYIYIYVSIYLSVCVCVSVCLYTYTCMSTYIFWLLHGSIDR